MGDIAMIKGGACLVAQTRRRVVIDVVEHSGINIGLRVYQREEGEETVNTCKYMHNKTTSRARRVLTRCYTLPAKGKNIRECFPEVWHFRTDETEGDDSLFSMLGACDR